MSLSFIPNVMVESVTQLTPDFLKARGIRLLMLDFDNTIVPYTTDSPSEDMEKWLKLILQSDIQICVVSNSKKDRVKIFCKKRGIPCITHARKPFSKGIRECLDRYGIPESQCALAGDQIYTDVLGARSCGVQAVLTRAISNHNFLLKLRHVFEMPFILAAQDRRLK